MPVYQLNDELIFPNPNEAIKEGLLAVGGDLSAERILQAYSNGIFPWYSDEEPIMWWSPNPRLVLFPEKFKISKSLKQKIRKGVFEIKFDSRFEEVIEHCSEVPRAEQDGTWITEEMKQAYINLYNHGFAHSVETYYDGKLVGGLYGLSLGNIFFGESMFHILTDASKVAFYFLVEKIKEWNFDLIDCQVKTNHLISLGAEEISREKYLELLSVSIKNKSKVGKWNRNS
ncbi:MAG: leucyl/phenylalanyl-tRNA--protein transferase [Saprospiraceae bacterium]|nr:leucyl/phenylalanyl-tRNA--protein transferase [Saprospiraceae bacterium]